MESIEIDSYPAVKRDIVLHLTPSGANVSGRALEDMVLTNRARPIPVATVNLTAREVLRRCTGQITLREIAQKLLDESGDVENSLNIDEIIKGTLEFAQQATRVGILEPHKIPTAQAVCITGSTKCFIPAHMSIELTSGCNLRCIYCYRDSGPDASMILPAEQLLNILERLVQMGLRSVELTGGEPLLHPQFHEILQFCMDKMDRVALLTNGTLITEELARILGTYRERLLVQLDLDSSYPDRHDELRGVSGAFGRTKRGLEFLVANNVNTRVAMNVTSHNAGDIEATLMLAKNLGAAWFSFSPILNFGRGRNVETVFSGDELKQISQLSQRLAAEQGSFYSHLEPEMLKQFETRRNCGAGYRAAALGPDGKVRPCPLMPEGCLTIGDLTKQSVLEVFSNPIVTKLYDLDAPGETVCTDCPHKFYCKYCLARGLATQAELDSPCKWVQANEIEQWVETAKTSRVWSPSLCKVEDHCK